jgi:mono/diheme cytochrome c family protein
MKPQLTLYMAGCLILAACGADQQVVKTIQSGGADSPPAVTASAESAAASAGNADMTKAPDASGPPPFPPYQMRAEPPPGDRTATDRDGGALFSSQCGACHLAGGMGTNVLAQRMIATGRPPQEGLLENRRPLPAEFVTAVVRNGQGAMPPLTRVDVTDAELTQIAAYLSEEKP